jgi:fumarate reductase flavoprotein subunit
MGIVQDSTARFDTTASVVVIGAGGAGATAALAARSAGADVLVLDRDAAPSGATACSSGMVPAAGTAEQKARGIADSPQRFADDIQAKANGSAHSPLVKALTDASAKVLEWLTKQYGIRFELVEGVAPGHSLSRMHALADRGGATLLSSLYSALGTQGVRMQPSAHVTDLVTDDAQRIIGVRYKRGSKVESVGCTTLILACNGFAGNSSLVAKYLPDVRALPFAGHDGSQGDALAWGTALEAQVADIDGFLAHGAVILSQRLPLPWSLMATIIASLRLPRPKPSVDRNTPVSLAFCSTSRWRSEVLVTPTLKSPSVQRMTRFVPPLMKLSSAIW